MLHPYIAQPIVEQRRAAFVARAEAHRQASLASRADTRAGGRLAYNTILAGSAAFAVRPIEAADGDRLTRLRHACPRIAAFAVLRLGQSTVGA